MMRRHVNLSIKTPEAADQEVRAIVATIFPDFDFSDFDNLLDEVVRLYEGRLSGFAGCDTCYHNLGHTMESLVATARLLHGIHLAMQPVTPRLVYLCLISVLYHDSGYIRRLGETQGTGAQFTRFHVQRSVDMLKAAGACRNWPVRDIDAMAAMIRCTDPASTLDKIEFPDKEARLGGCIVGTADLISQMADDVYLERLSLLYQEFTEAGISEYETEYDLVSRTKDFCQLMLDKMQIHMGNVLPYMTTHFRMKYGIDRNLYHEAVTRNMDYLRRILKVYGEHYHKGLRRHHDRAPMPVRIAA